MRILRRLAGTVVLVWLTTWAAILATGWVWTRDAALPAPADAIVCLGGDMSQNGWERPGPASARRALTCADLERAGVAPVIVFTGAGNAVMSAGEAMGNLAASRGVPAGAIVVEPDARSTLQNAAFSLALLPEDTDRIVVVSDAFHLPRSWVIFNLLGEAHVDVHAARRSYGYDDGPRSRTYLEWTLRETVAVWVNVGRISVYLLAGVLQVDPETRISWFD